MVNRARTHVRSAVTIAGGDPTLVLSACHDAARQAVSAHMRASGYRPASEAGAHRLVVEYAEIVLAGVVTAADIEALDVLRRDRNTAEYGDFATRVITEDRARDAAVLANRVIDAIAGTWSLHRTS